MLASRNVPAIISISLVWLPIISAVKKQKLDRVSTSIRFEFVAAVVLLDL